MGKHFAHSCSSSLSGTTGSPVSRVSESLAAGRRPNTRRTTCLTTWDGTEPGTVRSPDRLTRTCGDVMATRSAKLPDTLPADLTSFVGRRPDIAAIRQLLASTRLVTLTGIGGVGKTRLAIRAAGEVRRAFPDGVCLVELATLTDPSLLPLTVINSLAIPEQSAREPMIVLSEYLRHRQLLLVLDNCEHLLDAAAELAVRVLRAAPDVRVLATSRQALRVAGEHVYLVPPLPAPDPDAPFEPGTATQFPSVALFADRSAAVVPGFTLTPENEAAVARLCQRLEGIPLAIELASVRLRVLTVDELANRLDDRFQVLREGTRDLPRRHQTLRALIDWSYDLCATAERTLWARASVFVGGFTVDALESVCTDESLPREAVLDTVAGLVDKSIFLREEHENHMRFRMLETIRAYGQARLREAGNERELRRLHRDWCLRHFEKAGEEWVGPRQEDWARVLQLDHPNLRGALEFCLSEPGEARTGLRLAATPWFWLAMGLLTEGRLWLNRALSLDDEPSPERAWALATAAYIAFFQADQAAVAELPAQARQLAVELDDPAALAYATHVLGLQRFLSTDLAGAVPLLVEALERYAETDVTAQYPDSLRTQLGLTHLLLGDLDSAAEVFDTLFERCDQAGERWLLSYALWGRGFLELMHGDLERAENDLCETLKIKRFFHDSLGLAFALDVLAWTTAAKGSAERSAALFGAATQLWQTIGAPILESKLFRAQRDKFEEMARKKIGDAAFDAAFAQGSALTIEKTLARALRERAQPTAGIRRAPTELTRREREVADLVAEGLSNKDAAARLVISQRTAEGHVENILTKLGFTSRAQIASWVAQHHAETTGHSS